MWKEEAGRRMINSTAALVTDPTVRLRSWNHLFRFFTARTQHRKSQRGANNGDNAQFSPSGRFVEIASVRPGGGRGDAAR